MTTETLTGHFTDSMTYDANTKTAVSVRDGVLEYLGSEIGAEPSDKLFRVFRSPSTIANVVPMMAGIPLTDEHVSLDEQPSSPVGSVIDATTVDLTDESTDARLGIRNRIKLADTMAAALVSGKRELSLGYTGELVPYEGSGDYDFEQRNIRPHHLAVVTAGRCGPACSFIDRKATTNEVKTMPELHKAFCDAEGQMNLEEIIEITAGLPEAIKKMPIEQVAKLMEPLREAMAASRAVVGEDMTEETETVEVEDEEVEKADMKPEEKFTDSKEFADAVAKAQADAVAQRDAVVAKAIKFVDGLQVAGKTNEQVMREVLTAEGHDAQSFSDSELSVAFKLLKPEAKVNPTLMNFGDKQTTGKFAALADKEV